MLRNAFTDETIFINTDIYLYMVVYKNRMDYILIDLLYLQL